MAFDISEPKIQKDEILFLDDPDFRRDHVIIVSGAATGIGRAVSVVAGANGLTVVGLDVAEDEAKKTGEMVRDQGGEFVFIRTDLTRDEDMTAAVSEAAKAGTIKYLANIAGIQHVDPIEKFPIEKFDLMHRIMVRAPFYLSGLAIPHMQKSSDGKGVVANMASVHAHVCTLNKSSYNITKFSLRALSQSISAEGGGKIRSFSVSTGFVKTPLALNQIPSQAEQRGITPEQVVTDVMMGTSRIKEMMSPVEVGNTFLYGMSRFGKYLIGGDLLFDGGMVLTY